MVLYYPKDVQRYNLNCGEFAVSFYPYKELRRDVNLYQLMSLVELLESCLIETLIIVQYHFSMLYLVSDV